jgi:hypothetical protein
MPRAEDVAAEQCCANEQNAGSTVLLLAEAQDVGRFISERTHGQVAYYSREADGCIVAWM